MSKTKKKIDFSKCISSKTGLSVSYSKKIIDDLIVALRYQIKNGSLILKNIGTFRLLDKKERIGRNPKTKERYLISKRKAVSFSPSKRLTNLINKEYE